MLDRQKVVLDLARKLQADGWRHSYNAAKDTCLYRHRNGRKCAIGWLLSEVEIPSRLNDVGLCRLLADLPEAREYLATHYGLALQSEPIDEAFLMHLQGVHDGSQDGGAAAYRDSFLDFVRNQVSEAVAEVERILGLAA